MPASSSPHLTHLRVGNFKGFGGQHEVRLSKLTLIFGPNSAGKSALLHALLLLSQSLPQHPVGLYSSASPSLLFNGDKVDLGGFRNALHRHDLERSIQLGITQSGPQQELVSFDLTVEWDAERAEAVIARFRYRLEGSPENDLALRLARPEDIQHEKAGSEDAGSGLVGEGSLGGRRWFVDREGTQVDRLQDLLASAVPRRVVIRSEGAGDDQDDESLTLEKDDEFRTSLEAVIADRTYGAVGFLPLLWEPSQTKRLSPHAARRLVGEQEWAQLLRMRARDHWKRLRAVRHIGPLREAPRRAQVRLEQALLGSGKYVGSAGAATADVLLQNPHLIDTTNGWLARLGMPYAVRIQTLELEDAPSAGSWGFLLLDDLRTKTRVSLSDVGVGVSQVLPIIAQVIIGSGDVTLIEQPELHLHPAAQTQLGDLFASAVSGGGQLIVETHSEHLLLRLLRRVREGTLAASDLEVVYVDPAPEGGSRVIRLRIDENGEFLDEWPNGFFEERVDELLD